MIKYSGHKLWVEKKSETDKCAKYSIYHENYLSSFAGAQINPHVSGESEDVCFPKSPHRALVRIASLNLGKPDTLQLINVGFIMFEVPCNRKWFIDIQ